MHIIKQLSEDEFVIKMDDYDLDRHDSVHIAHDYVQFSGRTYMNVEAPKDWKPYGKFKSVASNIMGYYTDLQIPIRQFIKVVLPFLHKSKYCQEAHITNEDGTTKTHWSCHITNDGIWYTTHDLPTRLEAVEVAFIKVLTELL